MKTMQERMKQAQQVLTQYGEDGARAKNKLKRQVILPEGAEFHRILTAQKGLCGICNNKLVIGRKTHRDHCHATLKFRGILCSDCNMALGFFKDNITYIENAIIYLLKYQKKYIKETFTTKDWSEDKRITQQNQKLDEKKFNPTPIVEVDIQSDWKQFRVNEWKLPDEIVIKAID